MPQAMLLQCLDELAGCLIAAAVGVEDGVVGELVVVAGRHRYGFLDERSLVIVIRRPTHHRFGIAIDDGRQIDPAFPRAPARSLISGS
jgi:hypothetical protein